MRVQRAKGTGRDASGRGGACNAPLPCRSCTRTVLRPVAPPGFCNGGSEVWVYRGSRVRSPPVPVVLFVYQRGSLLDGRAMYLSRDTKKFHDNESTHTLHNFWTSTHRGESFPFPPPWRGHYLRHFTSTSEYTVGLLNTDWLQTQRTTPHRYRTLVVRLSLFLS